MTTTVTQTK